MIKNYILVSYRNILRHFSVSFINIVGLSIGLACSMMIFLWVADELSFDRFHKNADRIYRVEEDQHYSNGIYHVVVTPWPSGPVWKEKIPEIEEACRIAYAGSFLFTRNDLAFYEDQVSAVDSTFFQLFSFRLLSGNPKTALKEPGSVVISSEMARKYFGDEEPLGKSFTVNNKEVFQVTGVMQDMPSNSSIDQDFLIPFDYMKKSSWYSDHWGNNSIFTYVKLRANVDPLFVNEKLTKIVRENVPESETDFLLASFVRMHLYTYWGYGHSPGAILNVWIFSSIALLVLIIACINFMNLSTARSAARAKEIGLRKVNGANRKNLVFQFYNESMLMSLIAMVFAFVIVASLLGPFNLISGKEFTLKNIFTLEFIAGALVITLFTGLVAGTYPSLVLSAFKPVNTLKGGLGMVSGGKLFRKITVIIQFALSIILITGTIVINRQLQYMQAKKLGYDKENLLYMPMRGEIKTLYPTIKEELLREPVVKSITASTHPPHHIGSNSAGAFWEGKPEDLDVLISMSGVDYDYVETMGIEMKSGRTFSKDFSTDVRRDTLTSFLINEQMEKLMGMDDVVGAKLRFNGVGPVVGVMKDFNYHSLRDKIEPLAISIGDNDYWNFIYIRIFPGNLTETMKKLEKAWKKIMPAYPFEYSFVDEEFDKMYRTEERMGRLMNYFSILAILIACIGLFGLATFTVEQKAREMGIRKAMGAPSHAIFSVFTREFIQLQLIAAFISIPAAWFLLSRFLRNYNYRVDLSAWIFILAALISILVALVAISVQTLRAVRTDPAQVLKQE